MKSACPRRRNVWKCVPFLATLCTHCNSRSDQRPPSYLQYEPGSADGYKTASSKKSDRNLRRGPAAAA